jgi:metallophosphoesterase (TIGR00282 family)
MEEEPATPNPLRILFLGDIFGEPGRKSVIEHLPALREKFGIDFTIVNGENAAGGRGISPKIAISLLRAGVTVITLGDHAWDQPDITEYMPTEPRLLRPLNYPPGAPGHGSLVLDTPKGRVGVLNVQGRVFMAQPLDNPFLTARAAVDEMLADGVKIIFVDFHAEATSEKIAFGRSLEGLATAVVGTHTHVQTADEIIFPGGTAYLTDAGMCGPLHSVIGSDPLPIIHRFCTNLPSRNHVARGDVRLSGCIVDADPATGRALRIQRLSEIVSVPS